MSSNLKINKENLSQLLSKKFFLVILIGIPSAIVTDFFNIPLAWFLGPKKTKLAPHLSSKV